jgi:hypothetical protein
MSIGARSVKGESTAGTLKSSDLQLTAIQTVFAHTTTLEIAAVSLPTHRLQIIPHT